MEERQDGSEMGMTDTLMLTIRHSNLKTKAFEGLEFPSAFEGDLHGHT